MTDDYRVIDVDEFRNKISNHMILEKKIVTHQSRVYLCVDLKENDAPSIARLSDSLKKAIFSGRSSQKKFAIEITHSNEKMLSIALETGLLPQLTEFKDDSYNTPWTHQIVLLALKVKDVINEKIDSHTLVANILDIQKKINDEKETFRKKLSNDSFANNATFRKLVQNAEKGKFDRISEGVGGALLLEHNGLKFIVKANDEDALCLNNAKKNACPFISYESNDVRLREDIPTYQSAPNEALSSDIASMIGASDVTPTTVLAIMESDQFHLFTDNLPLESKHLCEELIPFRGKEKLCSVQEYAENTQSLVEYLEKTKKGRKPVFDPADFEKVNILMWVIGDQDGHPDNFRTYTKDSGLQGLIKIDNALAFGESDFRSGYTTNQLQIFDQMQNSISEEGKTIIRTIPQEAIVERMRFYGKSQASIDSLIKRVEHMQALLENPNVTLKEMDHQLTGRTK